MLGILAFSLWLIFFFLFLYTLFRYLYYPKIIQYSYEVKGISASDQLLGLLGVSAYQTLATFLTTIQMLTYGTISNLFKFLKYILLSVIILTCFGIFWLEYHPEILSVLHSAYNCVISPFIHFLPNLFLLIASFLYGIIWPILAFIGESMRFFTREIPIYLLFCSSLSIIDLIPRIGTLFRAFGSDISNGFMNIEIPYSIYIELNYSSIGFNALTYGSFDFSQTFTELSGILYFTGYGFGQCACSSGSIVWDSIFGWLYTSNPNITIGGSLYIPSGGTFFVGINNKRSISETAVIQSNVPSSDQYLPISSTGKLSSSVVVVFIEVFQLGMRCVFGTNPPVYPYQNATYFAKFNTSLSKTPGYYDLSDLINNISHINNLNFYNNLTSIPGNSSSEFLYFNDPSLNLLSVYKTYNFPPDTSFRYFPNIKPLLDKIKMVFINASEFLDYIIYNIYYVIVYVIKGFVPLTYNEIAVFPPSNGSTRFAARLLSLILDLIEYVVNLLVGFGSHFSGFCDIREARIYFDTGGSSTLYYMHQMINLTYLSPQRTDQWGQVITNPALNLSETLSGNTLVDPQIADTIVRISKLQDSINKESTKLRFFGTLELFVSDFSLLFSYISPYLGRWVYGILSALSSAISGVWNMIWRTIIHLADDESKMFPAGVPPNGYPLSDSFVPKPYAVWPIEKSIPSSECSLPIYSNKTKLYPGNFFVFLQDNYNELTGVNNKFLYGLYYSLLSISDAIGNGGSQPGSEWYLNFGLLPLSLWDSFIQGVIFVNIILFFESLIQRQMFIQVWKFNEFPEQLRQTGHKTRDSIMTLDPNINCTGKDDYDNTDAGFVCSLAYTSDGIFSVWITISEQLVLIYTSFSNPTPTPDIPDFEKAINITEYLVRNLTSTLVDIIPPLQVNADGTTLDEIIMGPIRNFLSLFFIFLTVPNYILRVISSSVKTSILNSDPPETAFLTFALVVGSIFQYLGDQLIFRGGQFLESIAEFLDRIFFTGTPIFQPIVDALILIINVIRNSFTEFAIKLLAYTMKLIGTIIALFFDSQDPVTTRLSNFFSALGDFILFFIIQAPTFLLDFLFGLIEIIIPAPLGTFIVTIARFIINGLCQIFQFFITVVIDIINAFGASLSPIDLCCGGGCQKRSTSTDEYEYDDSIWNNVNLATNEEPNSNEIIKEVHGNPSNKFTNVNNIHSLSKLFVQNILKKSYSNRKPFQFDDPDVLFKKFNLPVKKLIQMTNGIKNAYQKKSENSNTDQEYEIDYESQTCDISFSSKYTDSNRVCIDHNIKIDPTYKRFVSQNTTQNVTVLSMDEAMTFIINMVPWNGSSGCDLFMTDFIKNNRTISNFTILEKIYVIDCVSKRSVGEIISIFPQFRWIPPDILYNPFSIFKTVTESILAYKIYVQYQRDKVVPRSVFLSDSYKAIWTNWGLNTTYMTEDNYETVLLNYTLIDYMKMNNGNPDFVDAIYDILNMTVTNVGDVQASITNMSVDYQLSSIKYLDAVVENYLSSQNTSDSNSTNVSRVTATKMWVFFLSTLSSTYSLMKRTYNGAVMRSEQKQFKNVHQITKNLVFGTIPFLQKFLINEKEEYDTFMKNMDMLEKNGFEINLKTMPLIKRYYEERLSKVNSGEQIFQSQFNKIHSNHAKEIKRSTNKTTETSEINIDNELLSSYEKSVGGNTKLQKEFMYACEHLIIDLLQLSTTGNKSDDIMSKLKRTERFIYIKNILSNNIKTNLNQNSFGNNNHIKSQLDLIVDNFSSIMILDCVQKKLEKMDKNTYKFEKGYAMTFLYPAARLAYFKTTGNAYKNIIIKKILDSDIPTKLYKHFTTSSPLGVALINFIGKDGPTDNHQNDDFAVKSSLPKRNVDIEILSNGKFKKIDPKPFGTPVHKTTTTNHKRNLETTSSLNISVSYPCVQSILGYCTNCALLDSTFSMFFVAGSRLLSNYSASNTSLLSKNVEFFNTNLECITFVSPVFNSSCGCLGYYYSFYTDVNWSSPNQTHNPLAFPSGIRILPGMNGRGTFFDLFGGNPLESIRNYFSDFNVLGYLSFEIKISLLANFGRPNSIKDIKTAIENSYPESETYSQKYLFMHDPFMSQTLHISNTNNAFINSIKTKNNQKRNSAEKLERESDDIFPKATEGIWNAVNYASKIDFDVNPSLSSQFYYDFLIPKSIMSLEKSISICEIFVLNTIGKLSSKNLARICDLFGWPEIQYTTNNQDTFSQNVLSMKTFYHANEVSVAVEQNKSSVYTSYPFKNVILLSENNPKMILDYFGVFEYVTSDILNNYPLESDKPIRQTLNTKIFMNVDDPNQTPSNKRQSLPQKTTLAQYIEYIYMEYNKKSLIESSSDLNNIYLNTDVLSESLAPPAGTRVLDYIRSGQFDFTYAIFKLVNLETVASLLDYISQQIKWLTNELNSGFNDFSSISTGNDQFSYFDYYDAVGHRYSTQSLSSNSFGANLMSIKSSGYSFVYYLSESIPTSLDINVGINMDDYSNTNLKIELSNYFDFVNGSQTSSEKLLRILTTSDTNVLNNPLFQVIVSGLEQNANGISPNNIPTVYASVLSTVYQTYVQPNYDYTCEVYRRTTLFSGLITVGFIFSLISLGILIMTNKYGLSAVVVLPLMMGLVPLYLIAVLIYVYNYPILNLFPFMLPPPCLNIDLYQMWTCDILPKCSSFFYFLSQNHDYTFDNCGTCPSSIQFDSCKYDHGFFDGVDTFLIIIKWFFPDIFKLLISSSDTQIINGTLLGNVNQFDYSIIGIITRTFPFSLLFGGDYFSRKIVYLSNIDMADKDQFDSIVGCLGLVGILLGSQSLSIGLLLLGIFFVVLIAIAIFIGQILGLLTLFYSTILAIQTTMLYNTVYATYPPNMMAVDTILNREWKRRNRNSSRSGSPKNTSSDSYRNTKSSSGTKKLLSEYDLFSTLKNADRKNIKRITNNRKPAICDRTDFIGWLYNDIWWRRVNQRTDYMTGVHISIWNNLNNNNENMYYKKSWMTGESLFMRLLKKQEKNKKKYD